MSVALWNHLLFGGVLVVGTLFALLNGMNDISGLIGSLCASRATSVLAAQGLAVAGIWLGVAVGSEAVAQTIATGLARLQGCPSRVSLAIWLGAVAGSLVWVFLARRLGIPTSSTHTFIGSLCGATVVGTGGLGRIDWGLRALGEYHVQGAMKVFLGLMISPLLGGLIGFVLYRLLSVSLRRASLTVNRRLRRLEVGVVFVQALSYGLNDAHTVMGVLMGACLAAGWAQPAGPFRVFWPVKLMVALALAVGAMKGSLGILRTTGRGLFRVRPPEALASQAAAALSVLGAAQAGAPVSSSQVTSSALVGAGAASRPLHVRWHRFGDILLTWLVTFPCAAAIGGATNGLLLALGRVAI